MSGVGVGVSGVSGVGVGSLGEPGSPAVTDLIFKYELSTVKFTKTCDESSVVRVTVRSYDFEASIR